MYQFSIVRNSQDLDSLIKAYIHQHIWLLFTSLALSLSENIYSNDQAHILDLDYARLAAQLQHKCITIVTHCLEMVPHDADGLYMFLAIFFDKQNLLALSLSLQAAFILREYI